MVEDLPFLSGCLLVEECEGLERVSNLPQRQAEEENWLTSGSTNILYPKEDMEQKILLYACWNWNHQVLQDVAGDPTLPRTKSVKCAACGQGEAVLFQSVRRAACSHGEAAFFQSRDKTTNKSMRCH
uniref:Uncharacterized protein n=1 Tax=Oryza punctata TaxID=4537 RepID=A0A0E0MI49_ORYPU